MKSSEHGKEFTDEKGLTDEEHNGDATDNERDDNVAAYTSDEHWDKADHC